MKTCCSYLQGDLPLSGGVGVGALDMACDVAQGDGVDLLERRGAARSEAVEKVLDHARHASGLARDCGYRLELPWIELADQAFGEDLAVPLDDAQRGAKVVREQCEKVVSDLGEPVDR